MVVHLGVECFLQLLRLRSPRKTRRICKITKWFW